MKLYAKYTRDGVELYSNHEGMDQTTVTALLTELSCTSIQFVEEAEYLASQES